MKPIKRHRNFEKNFAKRIGGNQKLRQQFKERLGMFLAGVRDYPLNDHPLIGTKTGKRTFSISPDIRVIYEETDTEILFLDIGSHNQVY
jgi:mRNA-degrading endonuclease YafQ of YafQ-DinJ toxin-antitoxin module